MQGGKKAGESVKETTSNIGASSKAGLEKTKATVQEKVPNIYFSIILYINTIISYYGTNKTNIFILFLSRFYFCHVYAGRNFNFFNFKKLGSSLEVSSISRN